MPCIRAHCVIFSKAKYHHQHHQRQHHNHDQHRHHHRRHHQEMRCIPGIFPPRCSGGSNYSSALEPFISGETPNDKRSALDLNFSGSNNNAFNALPTFTDNFFLQRCLFSFMEIKDFRVVALATCNCKYWTTP